MDNGGGNQPGGALKGRLHAAFLEAEKKRRAQYSGRLKGSLLTTGESTVSAESVNTLTAGLVFGAEGAGIGELEIDGFAARISNNSSGQDAMAISENLDVFVVADGLGGTAGSNPDGVR